MNTKSLLTVFLSLLSLTCYSQKDNFSYKFYGQVRGDLFYNSRANSEIVDGLFHLYPLNHNYDANGKDLNDQSNGSFYLLYTRLGVDINGPSIGKIKTSAKIETDFRGYGSNFTLLRIRHAYLKLDWTKSSLLIGQTWHPLFGDIYPLMINLSTGAPFNGFSRAPQIRYKFNTGKIQLTGAALWQLQFLSMGPHGKSESYIKHSCIPELYGSIDFTSDNFTAGIGAQMLSLVPQTQCNVNGEIYKVNERVTSGAVEAHLKYIVNDWTMSAKTIYGSNLSHICMLSGIGVTERDEKTGEQKYSPFRQTSTWINIVHGSKWRQGFFAGYMKNLGAGKDIIDQYGVGLEVGQLLSFNVYGAYVLPHWKFGVEYSPSTAWFGEADQRGRITHTHTVTNHRFVASTSFMF